MFFFTRQVDNIPSDEVGYIVYMIFIIHINVYKLLAYSIGIPVSIIPSIKTINQINNLNTHL